jgi:hypothetical protein
MVKVDVKIKDDKYLRMEDVYTRVSQKQVIYFKNYHMIKLELEKHTMKRIPYNRKLLYNILFLHSKLSTNSICFSRKFHYFLPIYYYRH